MQLISKGFADGTTIPRRFTCYGQDLSPPLGWTGAPAGTRSFVLLCDDPDAPAGIWHHWAAYDIAADCMELAEGAAWHPGRQGLKQATNDFRRPGYGGPCPPHRHGAHRDHFRLLALSIDHLPLGNDPSCQGVEREARRHLLAEAVLVGVYER